MRIKRVDGPNGKLVGFFSDFSVLMESLRITYAENGVVFEFTPTTVRCVFLEGTRVDIYTMSSVDVVTSGRHL